MIKISIDISGIPETVKKLDKIIEIAKDVEPEMAEVGKWALGFYSEEVFITEGAVLGRRWPDLSDRYKRIKYASNSRYPGRRTLERSGILKSGWKLRTASRYALLTNGVEYAKYHQYGTRKMPQRKIAEVTPDIADEIKRRFKDHFISRLKSVL